MAAQAAFVTIDNQRIKVISGDRLQCCDTEHHLSDAGSFASAIADALRDAKLARNTKLGLALPSRCFFQISIDRDKIGGDLVQQKYSLEEHVPLDAEEMAVVLPSRQGVAVILDTRFTNDLLACLNDDHDLKFDFVVPANRLIAECILQKTQASTSCLVVGSCSSDLVVQSDTENTWQYLPGPINFADWELSEGWCIALVDPDVGSTPAEIGSCYDYESTLLTVFGSKQSDALIETFDFGEQANLAASIDESITSPIEYIVFGIAVALMLVAIGLALRASSLREQAIAADNETRAQYRKFFLGERINAPIKRLLDAKVEKAKQTNGLVEFSNTSNRVLGSLAAALNNFPVSERYKLTSVNVFPDRVTVAGKVDSMEDLDWLRKSLMDVGYRIGTDQRYSIDFSFTVFREPSMKEAN